MTCGLFGEDNDENEDDGSWSEESVAGTLSSSNFGARET